VKTSYNDLNDYLFANRKEVSKKDLANRLRVWPSKLTGLLNPDSYRVAVDDELAARIAKLLNQPIEHVRNLYKRAA
jgi:plasmid maintenance system antidote protein VapI